METRAIEIRFEVESAPFVDSSPEVESAPFVDDSPEVEPGPFAESTPVIEIDPVVEPEPSFNSVPEAATIDPFPVSTRRRRSKEEMLARALVSDILVYNRDLRDTAIKDGKLLEVLGGEIKKSWELYKEKVTPDVANSTNHFREALNEILAEGEKVF